MLININPILSPELLFHLRSMGHGEKIILADANFPANTSNDRVIRLDGVGIKEAASAILSVFPLDSFIVSQGGSPALRMEVDDKPEELTETHNEFIEAVKKEFAIEILSPLSPGNFNLSDNWLSLNSEYSSLILFLTYILIKLISN